MHPRPTRHKGSIAATEKPIDETVIFKKQRYGIFLNNENKNCFASKMVDKNIFQRFWLN
jgi:ABC-type branched-subunit amino acid transport system ATPase component